MNRMEEYKAMTEAMAQPVPALDAVLDRAYKRKRSKTRKSLLRTGAAVAACFAVFVLLVNFCAPVAYACSKVPGLRVLAEAVTFSKSLTDAVENEYVQPIALSETKHDITASVEYLIVDQKQVNVFYRLESPVYTEMHAHPDILDASGTTGLPCAFSIGGIDEENDELRTLCIDFIDENVPESLMVKFLVDASAQGVPGAEEEFAFVLEFDPEFTATGKHITVGQTVELEGQLITVTDIEVYPTHLRVNIAEAEDNTAWLKDLEFYIETDFGMIFEPVSSGITATGSENSKSMMSYRADSTYFYEAESLKLVITGAKWLRKDMEKVYVNLESVQSGPLPEGTEFISAEKENGGWTLTFRVAYQEDEPVYQLIGHTYYDIEGNEYEIHSWSHLFGEKDKEGKLTYFIEKIPLSGYPYDEAWLSLQFSHKWVAQEQIVISIR